MYICEKCKHDCSHLKRLECVNFEEATPAFVYYDEIKKQNRNLHKICKKHKLKYYQMLDMLKGKIDMKYKYRMVLEEELNERDEYLPYIKDFEMDGEKS